MKGPLITLPTHYTTRLTRRTHTHNSLFSHGIEDGKETEKMSWYAVREGAWKAPWRHRSRPLSPEGFGPHQLGPEERYSRLQVADEHDRRSVDDEDP